MSDYYDIEFYAVPRIQIIDSTQYPLCACFTIKFNKISDDHHVCHACRVCHGLRDHSGHRA